MHVNSHPGHADHLLLRVSLDDGLLHHCGQDERELTEGEPEKNTDQKLLFWGRVKVYSRDQYIGQVD